MLQMKKIAAEMIACVNMTVHLFQFFKKELNILFLSYNVYLFKSNSMPNLVVGKRDALSTL